MANTVDGNQHVAVINSTSDLLHQIDDRSPSPAADALSLLDEPIDTCQNMISSGDISYVCSDIQNINSNSSSIISSTPIAQNRDSNNQPVDFIFDSDRDCHSSFSDGSFHVNNNVNRDLAITDVSRSAFSKTDGSSQSGSHSRADSPATYHSMGSAGSIHNADGDNVSLTSTGTFTSISDRVKTSIMGYEVMEERSRFTVFKVQVKPSVSESWFIFRRYNDFVRLNEKLMDQFPSFRLALPPKRWFGDNYDSVFLKQRQRGLQAFLNNVMSHTEVSHCNAVKTFLCLDDPPGEHESLEESKALCESLEEEIYHLQKEVEEKDVRISLLEEELELQRMEIENLKKTVKYERTMKRRPSNQSLVSTSEHNTLTEADQQRYAQNRSSKEGSPFKKSPSRDKLLSDITSSSPTITEIVHEESVVSEPKAVMSDQPKVIEKTSTSDINYSEKGIKTVKSDSAMSSSVSDNMKDKSEKKSKKCRVQET